MSNNSSLPFNQITPPVKGSSNYKNQGKSSPVEILKDNHKSNNSPKDQLKAATSGIANSFADQLFGGASRQEPTNFSNPVNFHEFLKNREKIIRHQERRVGEQQRIAEKVVYSKKEEETKVEIKSLQEEIKKLAVATQALSAEVIEAEKTVSTTIVATGTYHINFFGRIKDF